MNSLYKSKIDSMCKIESGVIVSEFPPGYFFCLIVQLSKCVVLLMICHIIRTNKINLILVFGDSIWLTLTHAIVLHLCAELFYFR